MNKPNLSKIFVNTKYVLSKHSPEILTGIGIAGMITTTVLAVKATPKATRLIEEARAEKNDKLTPVETVKETWKCYIPAAITGAASITCLIGASSVNAKRNAALVTAYKIAETSLTEFKEKVKETVGEKKFKNIKDEIAKDKISQNPVSKSEIYITDKGDTLFFDTMSGRYFKSSIDEIKKTVNEVNRNMLNEMYISLNDFYDAIGLDHIAIGYELGWNTDNGLIELDYGAHLSEDGKPCIAIYYDRQPIYGYNRLG